MVLCSPRDHKHEVLVRCKLSVLIVYVANTDFGTSIDRTIGLNWRKDDIYWQSAYGRTGKQRQICKHDHHTGLIDKEAFYVPPDQTNGYQHMHGWDFKCDDLGPIIGKWSLSTFDVLDKPNNLNFNIVDSSSPFILGWDVENYFHKPN